MNRTDRVLIAIAILFLLLTGGSFLGLDQWLFPDDRGNSGGAIAELVSGEGDVRVKFNDQFQWQKGRVSQKLVYDDAVFSGESSTAQLRVGESRLDMSSNTLIILRQEKDFKSLNLSRGLLSGLIAKNERLMIETGDGERMELKAETAAQVVIERKGGKTAVKVTSGNATLTKDGQTQTLNINDRAEFADRQPHKADPLKFTAPERVHFYSRESLIKVGFVWQYTSGRAPKASDEFILEFAEEPAFRKVVMRENLLGQTQFDSGLPLPQTLYYRVRDGKGNSSGARKLVLDRPDIPVITAPTADFEFEAPGGGAAPVMIAVQAIQPEGQVHVQISNQTDFANNGVDTLSTVPQNHFQFQPGDYFVRVRSQFEGGQVVSDWSLPVPFHVRQGVDRLHLRRAALKTHIVIPNLKYPQPLYRSGDGEIQRYLATMPPFSEFFKDLSYENHRLLGHRRGTGEVVIENGQFPPGWIAPGLADYSFRLEGQAKFAPLPHKLLIEMEAPNALTATSDGALSWSPVLLARSYEGRLISEKGSERFESSGTWHQAAVEPGTRYRYQVRALGKRGVPISRWSNEKSFETPMPAPVQPVVEQKPLASQERKPAKENPASLRVKKEEKDHSLWERIGLWLWSGSGVNYVQVSQTINNTADVEYKNTKGPSAFIEAGYMSKSRIGAAASYKRTPGEVRIDNYPVNKTDFVWTTTSVEGLWAVPLYPRLFNFPVRWILRAGVQNHYFPFLYVETGNRLIQGTNHMMTGSLGFLTETMVRKWIYHWSMRYQQPITSGSEGGNTFEVTPTVAFDGSVGASYHFTPRWKTGLFWYGQLHSYDFKYQSATQTNTGKQSLFYSNMELRLGVDF